MHSAIRFKNVSRRSFAHDDVLKTLQSVQQRFWTWWTAGNVNVDGNTTINALHRGVGVERSTGRRTCSHGNGPLRLRHLFVNAAHDRPHLQGHCPGDNDQITLSWTWPKDTGAEPIDIKSTDAGGNHLDRAAGQAKRPQHHIGLTPPIDDGCHNI